MSFVFIFSSWSVLQVFRVVMMTDNDAVVMLTADLLFVALLVVMTMARTMIDNGGLYDANDDETCDCDGGGVPMIVTVIINGDWDGDDVDHDVDDGN